MPYKVIAHVNHNGVALVPGDHVDDAAGAAILADHPGTCARIPHDDDNCPTGVCPEPTHPWNAKPAAQPAPVAAPAAKTPEV